jgi:hypothetical protein
MMRRRAPLFVDVAITPRARLAGQEEVMMIPRTFVSADEGKNGLIRPSSSIVTARPSVDDAARCSPASYAAHAAVAPIAATRTAE